MTTVVVDHGRANLFSLTHALAHLGEAHVVTADRSIIASASRIILPGVGAFGDVMKGMTERGLTESIKSAVARKVPLLGICVGMQMLAEKSEEFGEHIGLGLIAGSVRRLPDPPVGERAIRVPNVGWRLLRNMGGNDVVGDLGNDTMAYFVHSYSFQVAESADLLLTIDFNGTQVAAAIQRGAIVGYQFHPEKSGSDGLLLLKRFFERVKATT